PVPRLGGDRAEGGAGLQQNSDPSRRRALLPGDRPDQVTVVIVFSPLWARSVAAFQQQGMSEGSCRQHPSPNPIYRAHRALLSRQGRGHEMQALSLPRDRDAILLVSSDAVSGFAGGLHAEAQ